MNKSSLSTASVSGVLWKFRIPFRRHSHFSNGRDLNKRVPKSPDQEGIPNGIVFGNLVRFGGEVG